MSETNGQDDGGASDKKGEGYSPESALIAKRDSKLEQMAVRHRWPVPEDAKQAVVNRQVRIAIDPDSKDRAATSAARCIINMEAQNQADEHKLIPDKVEHSVVGILQDEDWYGTASSLPATAFDAPAGDPVEQREIQDSGRGPAGNENGNGADGLPPRPRSGEGDVQGSG